MAEKTGTALVAIGTNLAHRGLSGEALVKAAVAHLETVERFWLLQLSRPRITAAWPDPADPPFTNAVALLHAPCADAQAVLAALLRTEAAFGRVRGARNAPRTLDLDLIDLDGEVLDRPGLTLPHPRLAQRRFVLEPLVEIAPDWVDPRSGRTAARLLAALMDH